MKSGCHYAKFKHGLVSVEKEIRIYRPDKKSKFFSSILNYVYNEVTFCLQDNECLGDSFDK